MEKKITFKNLSLALKIAVISGWAYAIIFSLAFLIAFIQTIIQL